MESACGAAVGTRVSSSLPVCTDLCHRQPLLSPLLPRRHALWPGRAVGRASTADAGCTHAALGRGAHTAGCQGADCRHAPRALAALALQRRETLHLDPHQALGANRQRDSSRRRGEWRRGDVGDGHGVLRQRRQRVPGRVRGRGGVEREPEDEHGERRGEGEAGREDGGPLRARHRHPHPPFFQRELSGGPVAPRAVVVDGQLVHALGPAPGQAARQPRDRRLRVRPGVPVVAVQPLAPRRLRRRGLAPPLGPRRLPRGARRAGRRPRLRRRSPARAQCVGLGGRRKESGGWRLGGQGPGVWGAERGGGGAE
mmetsp:Transcript_43188/g.101970  ORF Transcript_43188/g.101970 Transcript_43188/m.101970 type:complete len:312 (+) Transcript_43188:896-1831(+)